jgi:hypothetical protein
MPTGNVSILAEKALSNTEVPAVMGMFIPFPKPGSVSKKYSAFIRLAKPEKLVSDYL